MENTNGAGTHEAHVRLDGELLADFGHQLRNQLNAIVGAAGLLSATATSSDQRELAAIVITGSEELAGLVDDVLDSELIQSGEFELALHPFNVRKSAETGIARVAAMASGKAVTINFRAAGDVAQVIIGDSRRLEQVLHALLRLAVDRTEHGALEVTLTTEPSDLALKLRFRVVGSGLTVPARVLDAAFGDHAAQGALEPGDRLTVLGLQTTRHIVEMMDGELGIQRTGEDGSTVTTIDFTFLAEAALIAADAAQSLAGMQVLVVAADASERRVLAMQAELWGAPTTAAEPAQALEMVIAGRAFDLALIEHRTPVIDGLALASSMRASRGLEELPIVLIVAGTVGEAEIAAADSGFVQATLAKPVAPQKLHDVMLQVGHRRTAPALVVEAELPAVPLRVLVADDNTLNQNMLRRQIAKLGHQVDVVSNGRDAVAAVENQTYDALLMDVLMPEMDGLQAAAEICRRWSPGTRPRLIALTAMSGAGDEERCIKAGFDDYMSKPVHLDELAESLRAAAGWRAASKTIG